jgi:hypothetical protein
MRLGFCLVHSCRMRWLECEDLFFAEHRVEANMVVALRQIATSMLSRSCHAISRIDQHIQIEELCS